MESTRVGANIEASQGGTQPHPRGRETETFRGEDRKEVLWEFTGRTVSDRVGMNLAFASNALKVILGTKIDSLKKHFNGSFFVLIKLTREAALWCFLP